MDDSINEIRLESLRKTVVDIRQLMSADIDRQNLCETVCRLLIDSARFHMAWIGMAHWETGEVSVVASHGARGNYLEIVGVRCDESPLGQGPTGRAIRHGLHQVNNDTDFVNSYAPWRDAARKMCYRSSASFPFRIDGNVAGAINVYANEPHAFGREETDLLDMVADLVGDLMEKHKPADGQRGL